eukprot:m.113006 g.113006  ORF g.113006 m.113006 type:complete len:335 (+) comp15991_c0_seq1:36-1040(+)
MAAAASLGRKRVRLLLGVLAVILIYCGNALIFVSSTDQVAHAKWPVQPRANSHAEGDAAAAAPPATTLAPGQTLPADPLRDGQQPIHAPARHILLAGAAGAAAGAMAAGGGGGATQTQPLVTKDKVAAEGPKRFIAIRGERHSGTNWLRTLLNLNCGNHTNADDAFGWKHDFFSNPMQCDPTKGVWIVLLRSAADWLPAMALDTFEKRFYVGKESDNSSYRPDPAVTVATLMDVPFPGAENGSDFANAVDMRNRKYADWINTASICRNILVVSRGKQSAVARGMKYKFVPRSVAWSEEDWRVLQQRLDLTQEAAVGYTYDHPPAQAGKAAAASK